MIASAVQSDDSAQPNASLASARKLVATYQLADGTVLTMPDLAEFEALARQYGKAADVELFRLLHRTYPDSHTAAYVTQTGEHSRCTNFAPGVFVPLYGDWLKFVKAHPDLYTDVGRREISAMEHELVSGKCACASAKVVGQALNAFVKAYPRGDVTPEVEGRLDQIKRRRPDFQFECMGLD